MAREWFVRTADKEHGPYLSEELAALVKEGQLKRDSVVKEGKEGRWIRASDLREISFAELTSGQCQIIGEMLMGNPDVLPEDVAQNPRWAAHGWPTPSVADITSALKSLKGAKTQDALPVREPRVAELKAADGRNERQQTRAFRTAVGAALAVVVFFVWIASWKADMPPPSPHTFDPRSSIDPQSSTSSDKGRRIDALVDREVEKNWRPMPDGNSKEDAAKLSKEILRAKSWEELDQVIGRNSREGR